ncbi:MAG: hypothetical protein RLZZ301_1816 [Bacteroidota bacterium]|jgi:hypothetical protein
MQRNLWEATKSLLVVFNYESDEQLRDFRVSLDRMLNNSKVERLIIVVNVPKELDKNTLPPHFLIYYNSPNDFTFFGKLKDIQLEAELARSYDVLIWFGSTDQKSFPIVAQTPVRRRIIVNEEQADFDLQFNAENPAPGALLEFVIQTLQKIAIYE